MKRLIHSILNMNRTAWRALSLTLALCCLMAFGGCVILFDAGPACFANFDAYRLAQALGEAPAGLLLLGCLAAVILEFEK